MQVEQSELREKINGRLGEDLTDEKRGELDGWTKRAQELEVELRAAIVAQPPEETREVTVDAEHRERVEQK